MITPPETTYSAPAGPILGAPLPLCTQSPHNRFLPQPLALHPIPSIHYIHISSLHPRSHRTQNLSLPLIYRNTLHTGPRFCQTHATSYIHRHSLSYSTIATAKPRFRLVWARLTWNRPIWKQCPPTTWEQSPDDIMPGSESPIEVDDDLESSFLLLEIPDGAKEWISHLTTNADPLIEPSYLPAEWNAKLNWNDSLYWILTKLWVDSSDVIKKHLWQQQVIERSWEHKVFYVKGMEVTSIPAFENANQVMGMALYLFEPGSGRDEKCTTCGTVNSSGPAKKCIHIDNEQGAWACTNCHSKGMSTKCSFRKEHDKQVAAVTRDEIKANLHQALKLKDDTDIKQIRKLQSTLEQAALSKQETEKSGEAVSAKKRRKK